MISLMKALLTFVAAVAFAAVPVATQGFRGFRPDSFPVPQIDPPVQPAGYAFGIWGLIYLWLIVGTGFGVVLRSDDDGWDDMRTPLLVSLAIGVFWIPVANASPFWATVMIWLMLAGALASMVLAGKDDRWFQREPVGLYAGWLTAAASVATGLLLAGNGLMSAQNAALVALVLALSVALSVMIIRRDTVSYAVAVVWALVGVIVANLLPPNLPVLLIAAAGIALLVHWGRLAWREG